MLMIFTGLVPLFVTVTTLPALLAPNVTLPNERLAGAKLRLLLAAPSPVRLIMCGLPAALSVMVIAPVRVPPAVGVNVTSTRHACPREGFIGLTQLLVSEKSPLATILVMVTFTPLTSATFADTVLLDFPIVCDPRSSADGSVNTDPVIPVPARLTTWGLLGASSVMVKVPTMFVADAGAK